MISKTAANSETVRFHRDVVNRLRIAVNDILCVSKADGIAVANAIAEERPNATVHVLVTDGIPEGGCNEALLPNVRLADGGSAKKWVAYLRDRPRPQAIIESGRQMVSHKRSCFQELFWALPPGGVYGVADLETTHEDELRKKTRSSIVDVLVRLAGDLTAGPREQETMSGYRRELATSVSVLELGATYAVIEKVNSHSFKLRDTETNEALTSRWGDDWGQVLSSKPAYSYMSKASAASHGPAPFDTGPREIEVPERHLRRYSDVECRARLVVERDGYVLPDSFRHPHQVVLRHRHLANASGYWARSLRNGPARSVDGEFYYFDTAFPGHFGHITTELLSHVWGWEEAVKANPGIRPITSLYASMSEIPNFHKQIFTALDIPIDSIEYIDFNETVRVESLVASTPGFENPHYADLDLARVWKRLYRGLPVDAAESRPENLFISRRSSGKRDCLNATQVEKFFAKNGFAILYPEDHSYVEQAHFFANARTIAGFGGSGMFNMMFNPLARVILVSSESYNAQNEYLLAAVGGNEIHYFWGEAQVKATSTKFDQEAFKSNFTFDVRRYRRALRRLVG